jgi:hypothetical protein
MMDKESESGRFSGLASKMRVMAMTRQTVADPIADWTISNATLNAIPVPNHPTNGASNIG